MKRFLSFMVVSLVAVLPLTVDASYGLGNPISCTDANEEGLKTCTVTYNISSDDPQTNLTVTLTEMGGAEITAVNGASGDNFSISNQSEANGVWTVGLLSPDAISGEDDLFSFTYRVTDDEDCLVKVALGESEVHTPTTTPDEPTDNVQTGSTLPFIALGAIALIAVGAYLTTRNKAKMYKI